MGRGLKWAKPSCTITRTDPEISKSHELRKNRGSMFFENRYHKKRWKSWILLPGDHDLAKKIADLMDYYHKGFDNNILKYTIYILLFEFTSIPREILKSI